MAAHASQRFDATVCRRAVVRRLARVVNEPSVAHLVPLEVGEPLLIVLVVLVVLLLAPIVLVARGVGNEAATVGRARPRARPVLSARLREAGRASCRRDGAAQTAERRVRRRH